MGGLRASADIADRARRWSTRRKVEGGRRFDALGRGRSTEKHHATHRVRGRSGTTPAAMMSATSPNVSVVALHVSDNVATPVRTVNEPEPF